MNEQQEWPETDYIYTIEGRQINAKDVNGHWGLRGIFSTEARAHAAMDEYLAEPLHRMLGYEYKLERAVMDQVSTYYSVPRDETGKFNWDLDAVLINDDVPALVRREKTVPLADHEVSYTEINDDEGFFEFNLDDKEDND